MLSTPTPTTAAATVQRYLDRINLRDNLIHAWAHLDPELAHAQARARDAEPPRTALHGVPLGIKDIIDTADQPTAYGSELWAGHRPARDADVIARLRDAGAVILGKTATTEFATYRPCATRNPHNPGHTPGGSSSGSAAAVADGQVPIALGTQTAGSVLRPGAYCGVFTLKPTYGRWPFDGVLPVALSFDTVGAFARHPAWLGELDAVLTHRPGTATLPSTDRLRVGVLRPPWSDRATPSASIALERFISGLAELGAHVSDVELPWALNDLDAGHTLIMANEAAAALESRLRREGRGESSDQLAEFLATGAAATANDIQQARAVIQDCIRFVSAAMQHVDVLVTLAATGEAPKDLTSTGDPVFNKLASVTGLPAVGLPVDVGAAGLPLGVQLIAPPEADHALVRIATCLTDRAGLAARCALPEEQ
ncbi:amidase [Mycobacterium sp. 360MFTsu5.1]|uniref:amidase n=1 Tax=Mycobacterium sp. 360MFTsu5.1 TaxID=1172186 RepID=UPI00035FA0DB|nr:amidase [Mycobacterium sp. 360MFTsu5.1]